MPMGMGYQEIADELSRQEGRTRRKFSASYIWKLERIALAKIREYLRKHPVYATELYALLDDNKSFAPRGAFRELSSEKLWDAIKSSETEQEELPDDC